MALRGLVCILVRAPLLSTNAVEEETRAAVATKMIEDLIFKGGAIRPFSYLDVLFLMRPRADLLLSFLLLFDGGGRCHLFSFSICHSWTIFDLYVIEPPWYLPNKKCSTCYYDPLAGHARTTSTTTARAGG